MTENRLKKELAKQYIEASMHYGHAPKDWNPKMAPYILHTKHGYDIFDLVKTYKLLKLAGRVVQKKIDDGGKILFVGTNKLSSFFVAQEAERCGSYYINYRWLGGMLTNWSTIQKRVEHFNKLEKEEKEGGFEKISKKESTQRKKEVAKLKRLFQGIKTMSNLPDIVIFTNQEKDSLAIQECLKLGIPAISIVDTNGDPDLIPYPIPANDDSSDSIEFILRYLSNQIILAKIRKDEKRYQNKN